MAMSRAMNLRHRLEIVPKTGYIYERNQTLLPHVFGDNMSAGRLDGHGGWGRNCIRTYAPMTRR